MPGKWLLVSSVLDILIVSILATKGILMTAINPILIIGLIFIILAYLVIIDFLKIRFFSYLNIR